jgi:hypothetical protein
LIGELVKPQIGDSIGDGDQMEIAKVSRGTGSDAVGSLEVVMVDPKGVKGATDGAKVTIENMIYVSMEDLT